MTGELTVTGKVLRIGGLREKTVAARRAGAKTIIFPADNMSDWLELPEVRLLLRGFFFLLFLYLMVLIRILKKESKVTLSAGIRRSLTMFSAASIRRPQTTSGRPNSQSLHL